MKIELKYIALMTYWLLLLGAFAPALISAASTELVFGGFLLLGASAYLTYRFIRGEIKRKENEAH